MISIEKKEAGSISLGYDNVLEEIFQGYVTKTYNNSGSMDEILLKDEMLLLEETTISETFLDTTPQEIIQYCLSAAGITQYQITNTIYQPRKIVPIYAKNAIAVLKELNTIWGIDVRFFFSGGVFYWGEVPKQEKKYQFEYGVNILSLSRGMGSWQLETVSAPFIKHSHKIQVTHPKLTGEFEVKKVVFRTNESGFIRTTINF